MVAYLCNCKKLSFFQNRLVLLNQERRRGHSYSSSIFPFLQRQTPFLYLIPTTSSRSLSTSTTTPTTDYSFTVSYLINSCGLSQQQALSASKKVQFETSSRPDSVISLLKSYGFSHTHIPKFVLRCPLLLLAKPDKTLKPKLEFFRSIGFTDSDLAKFLSNHSSILQRSLEKHIVPSYGFLKTIVHTDTNIIRMLKHSTWILNTDLQNWIAPNIAILRAHGVPHSNISMFLTTQPRLLLLNVDRFAKVVREVKEMGFDPLKCSFIMGVIGLLGISKSLWEAKVQAYRRWGWSEQEIRTAFIKQPGCMMLSEMKIMSIMDFFVNKMGFDPSKILQQPTILLYSLKERIIPRCLVLNVLVSNGLVQKDYSLTTVLIKSEKYFLAHFVSKFEKQVPQLLNIYQRR